MVVAPIGFLARKFKLQRLKVARRIGLFRIMPALHNSQKRPTERDNAVERQEQKLNTFGKNSSWTSSGANRLEEFDFGLDDLENNEKLEKNSALVQNRHVDKKKVIRSILESGKSKEEIIDLLAALIIPRDDNSLSQNKADFETASKVDLGPLPENPVRYADRKLHPEYADMNAVEFLRAVWGKWIDAGCVYQDDIGKRDDKLVQGVRNACSYLKLDAAEILPPPKHARLDNEVSNSSRVKSLIEARRAAARRYAEKQRSIKLIPTY